MKPPDPAIQVRNQGRLLKEKISIWSFTLPNQPRGSGIETFVTVDGSSIGIVHKPGKIDDREHGHGHQEERPSAPPARNLPAVVGAQKFDSMRLYHCVFAALQS